MKVVLRHQFTGRYYSASGAWVRRSDNALTFDDTLSAKDYLRSHRIDSTQAVFRLAPFLMALLQEPEVGLTLENPREIQARARFSPPLNFSRN